MASGRRCLLEPDHTIGRAPAPASALQLDRPYVSGVHAALRWVGNAWTVRDLGSRNGTFLNGQRIPPGAEPAVEQGAKLGFGTVDEAWALVDDAAPAVMVVPIGAGDPVIMPGDLLALPSVEDPYVTVYRADDGSWRLELPNDPARRLANRDTFEVKGQLWRFCCPDTLAATVAAAELTGRAKTTIRNLRLEFEVSRDEEFVDLHVVLDGARIDLGARAHNYLLLTLARRRLADMAESLADTACGWMDQEELAHDPSMAPPRLNTEVFRIRKRFAALDVIDPANIVERRLRPAQLRIGTGNLSVVTL